MMFMWSMVYEECKASRVGLVMGPFGRVALACQGLGHDACLTSVRPVTRGRRREHLWGVEALRHGNTNVR